MPLSDNFLRRIIVRLWRSYKRWQYRKINVFLDTKVIFSPETFFGSYCRIHGRSCVSDSHIGSYTYIGDGCELIGCKIGNFCSLAGNIQIVNSTHPTRDFVSTSPAFHSTKGQCGTFFVKEDCFEQVLLKDGFSAIIGNDVWVGQNVLIIGGLEIGNGSIIAAGSIVTKDVPPYAIVGGVPAKIIRYRFTDDQISKLMADQWWNKPEAWLRANASKFRSIDQYLKII